MQCNPAKEAFFESFLSFLTLNCRNVYEKSFRISFSHVDQCPQKVLLIALKLPVIKKCNKLRIEKTAVKLGD